MDDEQEYSSDYENDDESWDDDTYYHVPELESEPEPADEWDGYSQPQAEQFEYYDDYDTAKVQYAIQQSKAKESPQDIFQQEKFNASVRQGIGDLADVAGAEKAKLVQEIQMFSDEERRLRAEGDNLEAFRMAERVAYSIRALESLPASPVQRLAEEHNKAEIHNMVVHAVQNPDHLDEQIESVGFDKTYDDAQRVINEFIRLEDSNFIPYIDGAGQYENTARETGKIRVQFAEVPEIVAQQIRDGLRNQGSKFSVFDFLKARRLVGPNASNEAAIAKMPIGQYEKARNVNHEESNTNDPDLMSQSDYEKWRSKGGGGR